MNIFETPEILNYYGIYQTKKLSKSEIQKYLKVKQDIEKITKLKIEKMYLIKENAWGKEKAEYNVFYIAFDIRFKDLDEAHQRIIEYSEENKIDFSISSLCWFEKRKDIPTEDEYLISRYGIKIFDSGKSPSFNETIKFSQYETTMQSFRILRRGVSSKFALMNMLIQIYILKLGYPINNEKSDHDMEFKIARMISQDEKCKKLLDEYSVETDEKKKEQIVIEFDKCVKELKQVKFIPKLEKNPTMNIYEKLLAEKKKIGKLNLRDLTKEDLYIMYVVQKKQTYELCELYDVPREKIDAKRNQYKIKFFETIIDPTAMKKLIEFTNKSGKEYTYATLKDNLLDFEQLITPILEYMKDGDTYLLKEFWKFIDKDSFSMPKMLKNIDTDLYYKADLCLDLLLQNGLVKEVDFKQYKITSKGKNLLSEVNSNPYIDVITIPVLEKYLDDFKYFDLQYKEWYPEDLSEITSEDAEEHRIDFENDYLGELGVDFERSIEKESENEIKIESQDKIEVEDIDNEIIAEEQFKKLQEYTEPQNKKSSQKDKHEKNNFKPQKLDFEKINERKKKIGDFCEEMVLYKEREMLIKEGRKDLAKKVIWSSKEEGDGLSYDIKSYRKIGNRYERIYIEVKGTNKSTIDNFYVTIQELKASLRYKNKYYLCQIINAKKDNPKFKYVQGEIDKNFKLKEILFQTE